jgi:hypothetical protein
MSEIQVKIKTFLEILDNPVSISEYQISNRKKDLGLIISNLTPEEFTKEIPTGIQWIISSSSNEDFESILDKAIKETKNVLLVINSDISNELLSQIKEFSTRGIITKSSKTSVLKPDNIKIICITTSDMLDQISYPYFETLFGPVISL